MELNREIQRIVQRALLEDSVVHDVTTKLLVSKAQISQMTLICREEATLCGMDIVEFTFKKIDSAVKIKQLVCDGKNTKKGQKIMVIKGNTRAILSGERVALNFLGFLSGIATLTDAFVRRVRPFRVHIMDTRKTIPGLRALQRMAVRCGGGVNHRFDLNEFLMVKDNHLSIMRKEADLTQTLRKLRRKTKKAIEVEVDNLGQFNTVLAANPDIILLDNMKPHHLKKAVQLNRSAGGRCLLEASGGVTLRNVREIARTGVDRISVGALTHSAPAVDYSLEFGGDKL